MGQVSVEFRPEVLPTLHVGSLTHKTNEKRGLTYEEPGVETRKSGGELSASSRRLLSVVRRLTPTQGLRLASCCPRSEVRRKAGAATGVALTLLVVIALDVLNESRRMGRDGLKHRDVSWGKGDNGAVIRELVLGRDDANDLPGLVFHGNTQYAPGLEASESVPILVKAAVELCVIDLNYFTYTDEASTRTPLYQCACVFARRQARHAGQAGTGRKNGHGRYQSRPLPA